MAVDKRYTELPVATSLLPADIMAMVDPTGNITYQFTFAQLMTFLSQNAQLGAVITFGTVIPANSSGKDGDLYIKTDTGQFVQRLSGTWTVVYTVVQGVVGTKVTFGSADPANPAVFGVPGDVYINTTGARFFQQQVVSTVNTWVLMFTMATGPAGPRGNSVLNGIVNPVVTDGQNGDFWLNTATNTLFGPKVTGVWPGTGVSLAPIMPNQLRYGTTNPLNTLGIDGDFYINTNTWNIFGPRASGIWPAGIALGGALPPGSVLIPAGSALPFIVNYTINLSVFGNTPIIEVHQTDAADVSGNTSFQIYDVLVKRIKSAGVLTTLKVYGHDSGNGTTTIDDLTLVIRST